MGERLAYAYPEEMDRLDRLEGRKYVILVSTGRDTFSKLNLDQILKEISTYNGVIESGPIWKLRDYVYSHKGPAEARTDCEAKLLAFLSTNATPVSKMAVIRHLRIIGGDRSVTALAPMLLDVNMADHALYALEKIPGTAADQALIQAMSKAGGAIKTELIASLGRRKTTAAVASLSRLLKGEFAVAATTWKPAGTLATWSPWLIQTGLFPSRKKPSNSGPGWPLACNSA